MDAIYGRDIGKRLSLYDAWFSELGEVTEQIRDDLFTDLLKRC